MTGTAFLLVFASAALHATWNLIAAMGFVDNIAYVQAFRQLGLVIGFLEGVLVLHERVTAPKIAGRRLVPPTLGQWRLLECCDSPFAAGGSATREETALALAILSRPWRAGMRLLRSEWRKALALAPWRLPPSASRELAAWLAECWWAPERYVEDGSAPSPEAFAHCAPGAVRLVDPGEQLQRRPELPGLAARDLLRRDPVERARVAVRQEHAVRLRQTPDRIDELRPLRHGDVAQLQYLHPGRGARRHGA